VVELEADEADADAGARLHTKPRPASRGRATAIEFDQTCPEVAPGFNNIKPSCYPYTLPRTSLMADAHAALVLQVRLSYSKYLLMSRPSCRQSLLLIRVHLSIAADPTAHPVPRGDEVDRVTLLPFENRDAFPLDIAQAVWRW
jgi:hypothetical protein